MAYGIQVLNTSANTIQIDQDYRNLFYNRTVYYSDPDALLTILYGLTSDEFPAYDISTVNMWPGMWPPPSGYINIFKNYATTPPTTGYGFTVYKENGDVAFSNAARPLTTIGDTEYIWNSFPYGNGGLELYLPEPRPGKTRNIIFNRLEGWETVHNYNIFRKGYHIYFDGGEFALTSSISGGIQHLQMSFYIEAAAFLIIAIIDG
jgi:hypothetical protein